MLDKTTLDVPNFDSDDIKAALISIQSSGAIRERIMGTGEDAIFIPHNDSTKKAIDVLIKYKPELLVVDSNGVMLVDGKGREITTGSDALAFGEGRYVIKGESLKILMGLANGFSIALPTSDSILGVCIAVRMPSEDDRNRTP